MKRFESVPHRRQASSLRKFVMLAFLALGPLPAMSVSPIRANVEIDVPFAPGAAHLLKSSASELADHLPCINSISLEVVIIKTVGDNAPSKLNGVAQMKLAAERANALRRIFLNLGVPDKRIYTQAEATVEEVIWGQPLRQPGGAAKIEYTGVCKADNTGADCQVLCKRKLQ